jgi:hypothetical protein
VTIRAGARITVKTAVATSNRAQAHLWQLSEALTQLREPAESLSIAQLQQRAKSGLEAIHELKLDSSERGEWSDAAWSEEQKQLWRGLLGARNAAHHEPFPVVEELGQGEPEQRLRWCLPDEAIANLHSAKQQAAYRAVVHDQAVIPQLTEALKLVRDALSANDTGS